MQCFPVHDTLRNDSDGGCKDLWDRMRVNFLAHQTQIELTCVGASWVCTTKKDHNYPTCTLASPPVILYQVEPNRIRVMHPALITE